MRGATLKSFCTTIENINISIHAPHAGCDEQKDKKADAEREFQSTHPMRGATPGMKLYFRLLNGFQSTHPMRGATVFKSPPFSRDGISIHAPHAGCDRPQNFCALDASYFNPRTPCGVRLDYIGTNAPDYWISIHAPHAGCDLFRYSFASDSFSFQSTHPMRGATLRTAKAASSISRFQSTHPMRGATACHTGGLLVQYDFNPRTPCGVRQ